MLTWEQFRRIAFDGGVITVSVFVGAAVLGTALSLFFGIMGLSDSRLLRGVSRVYVEVTRGASAIVLVFFAAFAAPRIIGFRTGDISFTILGINAGYVFIAGTVALAILFGQLMGLVRSILVASAFPAAELDAFAAANRVSETLFTLIAAGALGSAFLPTFTGLLVKNDRASAWNLASSMINLVTLILSLAAVVAAWFAPEIVRYLLAPGLSRDPQLFALTVSLLRIQSISAVLFGLGGLAISILNAHQVFFIPQITAAMYQLGQIFGVLVLARWMGIYGLAWGVVGLVLALNVYLLTAIGG